MIRELIATTIAAARAGWILGGDKAQAKIAEGRTQLEKTQQLLTDAQLAIDVLSRHVAEADGRNESYQAALMAICAGVRNPREIAARALASVDEHARVGMRA